MITDWIGLHSVLLPVLSKIILILTEQVTGTSGLIANWKKILSTDIFIWKQRPGHKFEGVAYRKLVELVMSLSNVSLATSLNKSGEFSLSENHSRSTDFLWYLGLLDTLNDMNLKLEEIQKSLDMYLETKRQIFPRFYFLSNDDLLEILGQSKNPEAVSTTKTYST